VVKPRRGEHGVQQLLTKKRSMWCATTFNQEKKYAVCNNFQLGKEEKCGE
jgi:hypothetical protein